VCREDVPDATLEEIMEVLNVVGQQYMREADALELYGRMRGLRRGPQDCATGHPSPPPSGSRRVIPFAATVLRSLALLRYRSRASSHNDLTPLQGYRGLLASVFDLPWLVGSQDHRCDRL
jgi:hypothetical protein